jgi:hypothetical protein
VGARTLWACRLSTDQSSSLFVLARQSLLDPRIQPFLDGSCLPWRIARQTTPYKAPQLAASSLLRIGQVSRDACHSFTSDSCAAVVAAIRAEHWTRFLKSHLDTASCPVYAHLPCTDLVYRSLARPCQISRTTICTPPSPAASITSNLDNLKHKPHCAISELTCCASGSPSDHAEMSSIAS